MIEWLTSPVDITRIHEVGPLMSWHGRLMVLAWGVCVPLGVLIARYFKITPNQNWPSELDNRFWWRSHLFFQTTGFILMLIALALIWFAPRHADQSGIHYLFGWSLAGLGLVQVLGGYLRGSKGGPTAPAADGSFRGDHFDMTRRRVVFEILHKALGYTAIILSMVAIFTGLWQANAYRAFFVAIFLWWGMLLIALRFLQTRGLAFDTYQAIWGPDPKLPGNLRDKSIGIGVRRHK